MVEDALSASSLKYIVIDVSAATYLGHGSISGNFLTNRTVSKGFWPSGCAPGAGKQPSGSTLGLRVSHTRLKDGYDGRT